MKIAALKTFVVGNPPPRKGGRYFIFLKLATADGIEGVGEVYNAAFAPDVIVKMIEDVYARHVEGIDPFRIESLWRTVYGRGYSMRPDLSLMGVLSGLEMALWDINGKALGKPVYELLGGRVHDRLRTYTYIYPPDGEDAHSASPVYSDPDAAARRAADYLAMGFTAVKFDPVGGYSNFDPRQPSLTSLDRSEAFCRRLREAVGDQGRSPLRHARPVHRLGRAAPGAPPRALRPALVRGAGAAEMPEEMALVARQTKIPIATGERLATKYEFARVLELRAASILQMALGRVGGVLEAKKIAGMAEAHYAQIAPAPLLRPDRGRGQHPAQRLHAQLPHPGIDRALGRLPRQAAEAPDPLGRGLRAFRPTEPGLGVELDEAVALAHPWQGTELHLEMATAPIDDYRKA